MSKKQGGALKAAFVYAGIILGAGFASGAEISAYFVDYGIGGLWGLLLSCIIFALCGWAIWDITVYENINGYKDFMIKTMGKSVSFALEIMLAVFMFIVFSAMLAASGAAINESLGLSFHSGVYIAASLCFITFLFDMSGIISLNAYISPVIIFGCVFMGIFTYLSGSSPVFSTIEKAAALMRKNWYMAAITYVGYNITTAVAVLSSMRREMSVKGRSVKAACLSGILLGVLGFSIFISLWANYDIAESAQIPMLTIVSEFGTLMEIIFMALFLAACFTTAATNGFAVIETISGYLKINSIILKIIVSLLGVFAAYAGFSNFIRNIYPIFAVGGIIEMFFIFKRVISNRIR